MAIPSFIRTVALPLLAAAMLPLTAAAQQADGRAAEADAIFERAAAMEQEQPANFRKHVHTVARMYLRSASLRPAEDAKRIESLHRAGTLLYTVKPDRARAILAQAAELALVHGNPSASAHAFLDAAAAADSKRRASSADRELAHEYVTTARTLADSPVLTVEQRDGILRRIQTGTVAIHQ